MIRRLSEHYGDLTTETDPTRLHAPPTRRPQHVKSQRDGRCGRGRSGEGSPTGASDRVLPETTAAAAITSVVLANRTVALQNSLRTGLGLASAVTITHVFPVEHGFWVVLGAMSVLRSSALTTGTKTVRAVVGTIIGFVIGAAVITVLGVDPVVMWILMPIVVFGSAYVPRWRRSPRRRPRSRRWC